MNRTVDNVTLFNVREQALTVFCADRQKVGARRIVIVSRQAHCFPMIDITHIHHLFYYNIHSHNMQEFTEGPSGTPVPTGCRRFVQKGPSGTPVPTGCRRFVQKGPSGTPVPTARREVVRNSQQKSLPCVKGGGFLRSKKTEGLSHTSRTTNNPPVSAFAEPAPFTQGGLGGSREGAENKKPEAEASGFFYSGFTDDARITRCAACSEPPDPPPKRGSAEPPRSRRSHRSPGSLPCLPRSPESVRHRYRRTHPWSHPYRPPP